MTPYEKIQWLKVYDRKDIYTIWADKYRVKEFINRRFPKDSNWMNGNCFYFALILSKRFHGEIWYDQIDGHFLSKIAGYFYDYEGVPKEETKGMISLNDIRLQDKLFYDRLMRDCVK